MSNHRRSYSAIEPQSVTDQHLPVLVPSSTPASPTWHDDEEYYSWMSTRPHLPPTLTTFTPHDDNQLTTITNTLVETDHVVAEGRHALIFAVHGDPCKVCKVAKADCESVRHVERERDVLCGGVLRGSDSVIKVYEEGEVTIRGISRPALLMERIAGTLQDHYLVTDRVKTIKALYTALLDIHTRGICHGDLKPQNIFITMHSKVVLGDFGESTSVGGDKQSIGTPLYQPPEGIISTAADVYSLTVSAWTYLAKQEPFAEYTGVRLLLAIKNPGFLALHDHVLHGDPVWESVKNGALQSPEKRSTVAQILLALDTLPLP